MSRKEYVFQPNTDGNFENKTEWFNWKQEVSNIQKTEFPLNCFFY